MFDHVGGEQLLMTSLLSRYTESTLHTSGRVWGEVEWQSHKTDEGGVFLWPKIGLVGKVCCFTANRISRVGLNHPTPNNSPYVEAGWLVDSGGSHRGGKNWGSILIPHMVQGA
jgi:hypothetical protein